MGFKAGDVVVCVKLAHPWDPDYQLSVGQVYKVVGKSFDGERVVKIEGLDGWWSGWQFTPLVLENV